MILMTIRKYEEHIPNHKIYQFYLPKSELLQWRVSGFCMSHFLYIDVTIVIRKQTRAFSHVLTEMEQQYQMQQEYNIVFIKISNKI